MAGVLEQLFRPQKRAVEHCTSRMNPKAMELQTAMEILAEVFGIRTSEVEEMLLQRGEQKEQWPEGFYLAE